MASAATTLTGDQLFKCPNSGRIVLGHVSSNTVRCTCGKANPKLRVEQIDSTGFVHHLKDFLDYATAQDLINQRLTDMKDKAVKQKR